MESVWLLCIYQVDSGQKRVRRRETVRRQHRTPLRKKPENHVPRAPKLPAARGLRKLKHGQKQKIIKTSRPTGRADFPPFAFTEGFRSENPGLTAFRRDFRRLKNFSNDFHERIEC